MNLTGQLFGKDRVNLAGKAFGRDRVIEKIADGGMGSVWKTEHVDLRAFRALKVMPEGFAEKPDLVERFQREAQVMAQLHHPHIVQVYDFGCQEGIYYLIMEYVPGGNLRAKLREANGPLDWREALRILDEICEGLEYAHGKGVIHRDIKPENILIDEQGRVKIADFGLGKIMENVVKTRSGSLLVKEDEPRDAGEQSIGGLPTRLTPGELTMLGQVVGTLEYMSPEQRRGEVVDARSDIYSLGVVLFEMLTGRPPAGMELPSDENGVPKEFDDLTRKMLAPQQRRPSNLTELRKTIRSLITLEQPDARDDPRSNLPQHVRVANQVTGGSAFVSKGPQPATEPQTAAEQGDPEAQFALAVTYEKQKNQAEAAEWYSRAAELGHRNAQSRLGDLYFHGTGLPQDYARAAEWHRKAAEQGHANSQNSLAAAFFGGLGVPQDYAEAAKWFQKAAEQGHSVAQGNLGALYEKGWGVPQNYAEAARLYLKAAAQGDATRQYDIGRCLYNGVGISENKAEAIKWYRKAADQGNAPAQLALGLAYANGTTVEENLNEALAWIEKSLAKGHEPAKEAHEIILKKRDLVQKLSEAKCERTEGGRTIQEAEALCSHQGEQQARFDQLAAKFDALKANSEQTPKESPDFAQIAAEMTQTADKMTQTADEMKQTSGQVAQNIDRAKRRLAKVDTLLDQAEGVGKAGKQPKQQETPRKPVVSVAPPALPRPAPEIVRFSAKAGDELIFTDRSVRYRDQEILYDQVWFANLLSLRSWTLVGFLFFLRHGYEILVASSTCTIQIKLNSYYGIGNSKKREFYLATSRLFQKYILPSLLRRLVSACVDKGQPIHVGKLIVNRTGLSGGTDVFRDPALLLKRKVSGEPVLSWRDYHSCSENDGVDLHVYRVGKGGKPSVWATVSRYEPNSILLPNFLNEIKARFNL